MGGLKVGVVGAGGNGSAVCTQLLHLGVGALVTVDPELVEESNRNRLVGARPEDVGRPKVELVRRYGEQVAPATLVVPVQAPVEEAWSRLRDCDVIFGCTDDLSSRLALDRLCSQYVIPLIDTAVEIEVVGGTLRTIAGRVNVVRLGEPCLEALGMTSEEAAKREREVRARPGYVTDDPTASAMPANLLVAGAAGVEFLKLVHGLLGGSRIDRYWAYSARSGELRSCSASGDPCPACQNVAAMGDVGPSPVAWLQPVASTDVSPAAGDTGP
jgi:molybdopterin/thiamine biosynthesis adenylyltransferase